MPKKSHSEAEHQVLLVLTFLVLILGIGGALFAFRGYSNDDLIAVDRLVRYNLGFTGAFILTVRKCCLFFCIAAAFTALGAVVGTIGVRQNSKPITCVYNVSLIITGLLMFFLGVHANGRQSTVQPILKRQIDDFCRAPTFIRLTQQLDCVGTVGVASPPVACSATCQERAETLNLQGEGCLILTSLCNDWEYTTGSAAQFVNPGVYTHAAVEETFCNRKCDHDLNCIGYAYNANDRNCYIKSDNTTRYTSPEWTPNGVVNAMTVVKIKGGNGVLSAFETYGANIARVMITLGIVLVLVAALTWCILYNQNINRPGKPTAGQVFRNLCCWGAGDNEFREKLPFDDPETDGSISG